MQFWQNWFKEGEKHYVLRSINLLILFGIRKNCLSRAKSQLFYQFTKRVIKISLPESRNYYTISRHNVTNPSVHTKYCDIPSVVTINPGIQKLQDDNSAIQLSILSELKDLWKVMRMSRGIQNWFNDKQTQNHTPTHHNRTQINCSFPPYKAFLSIMKHTRKVRILEITDHCTYNHRNLCRKLFMEMWLLYAFTIRKSNEQATKN